MNATHEVLRFLNHLCITLVVTGGTLAVGCTANTVFNTDLRGRGEVPANDAEIGACKSACDTRSTCGGAKPECTALCQATSSNAAVDFKKCVDTSACDPACDAPLENPTKPDASAPDASSQDSGPATPDAGGDNLAACVAACGNWQVIECADGTIAQCTARCNGATPAMRATFATCTASSTTCPTFNACWTPFTPPLP